jgi:uncharacterized protein
MSSIIFHIAFPVGNIPETKGFYVDGLGCGLGRESDQSVILNLGGHQLVAHVVAHDSEALRPQVSIYPRHFGLVFGTEAEWQAFYDRARGKHLKFRQQARRRFVDLPLEHLTFFLEDPFGNLLEFKHYVREEAIFGDRELGALIGDRPT